MRIVNSRSDFFLSSTSLEWRLVDRASLPDESALSAVTLAELAASSHGTNDKRERARRQDRLQWAAATWDALPFNTEAARSYGRVFAATRAAGRSSRTGLADALIASTAAANSLAVYTRNPSDFAGLEQIVKVVAI